MERLVVENTYDAPVTDQVRCQPVLAGDMGPGRHFENQILAGFAMLARTTSMPATFGFEVALSGEVEQCGDALCGLEVHTPAATAVAAIGPAVMHELLAPKGNDPVPAVPSLYPYARFVYVNGHYSRRPTRNPQPPEGAVSTTLHYVSPQ